FPSAGRLFGACVDHRLDLAVNFDLKLPTVGMFEKPQLEEADLRTDPFFGGCPNARAPTTRMGAHPAIAIEAIALTVEDDLAFVPAPFVGEPHAAMQVAHVVPAQHVKAVTGITKATLQTPTNGMGDAVVAEHRVSPVTDASYRLVSP